MNEQRDQVLESLFAETQTELVDENFTSGVISRLEVRSRRVLFGRLGILALVIALEVLLDSPLQHYVGAFTELLGTDLFEIEHEWLSFIFGPVNSIAGLLGLTLVSLHFVYRRLFY